MWRGLAAILSKVLIIKIYYCWNANIYNFHTTIPNTDYYEHENEMVHIVIIVSGSGPRVPLKFPDRRRRAYARRAFYVIL